MSNFTKKSTTCFSIIAVAFLVGCNSCTLSRKDITIDSSKPKKVSEPVDQQAASKVEKKVVEKQESVSAVVDKSLAPEEKKEYEISVLSASAPLTRKKSFKKKSSGGKRIQSQCLALGNFGGPVRSMDYYMPQTNYNTEEYDRIYENRFIKALDKPLSTFSIDVDAASYSNVRRFINSDRLPPKDAVRIEEMINYFSYDYPQPKKEHPFSITTEVGACPWNTKNKLVHIGLQGKKVATESLPPSNLVFLLDVSGSMDSPRKLPLLKMAIKMLVKNLRARDKVAIAVYAGAAGLVLPSTSGDNKEAIVSALDKLEAGGSTAGGAGIKLAYKIANKNLLKDGNNRVILATDGDFNVGASSDAELVRMIEERRNEGIFLTVLGFGTGNYKDSKMEKLADKGNGNYAYIDNILEAKKVLVSEMGGTLLTIAKDVKIQIEFNPSKVQAYRLIGYENRKLNDEDFNDDKKDAGELGAGHTVTALYEIIPQGVKADLPNIDKLKYQNREVRNAENNELLTVKFRYKEPKESKSKLIIHALKDRQVKRPSRNFRFSAAAAGFGMLLRDSEFKGNLSYDTVASLAKSAKGEDSEGYRAEFIRMIEKAGLLTSSGS